MATPVRLLLVEDSEDDAMLLLHELRRAGFEPTCERVDTPEAMDAALDRQPWDIVISDHGMPRFSAPAALALLKKRGLDVPFLIVSGTMGEEAAVEAMKVGAQDYLLKGRLAKLGPAVARELREAEIRRARSRDMEKLRVTRASLDKATQQLIQAEKLTALGELVAGVAHEVNNPLTSVLVYTQLVLGQDIPPEARRRLTLVCSEAERAAKIVRNLLAFARKQPPERRSQDLNGLIEKTLELKAYHLRTNQIEVEKDLAADLPRTMLDFHQIQQVFLNLLNNAEHALGDRGPGGSLRLSTRRVGAKIQAKVSDNGPGIPAEIQTRIFEPFFTTKKEGKGTGLGLSLCFGIVQEHGGSIRVESEPGEGATFIVELPVLDPSDPPINSPEAPKTLPASGLRILVIDDEPNVRGPLVDFLTARGHTVDAAADVPDAVQRLAPNGHDLIITDMKMPHGTGRDIYEAVVARSPGLARRIVFTTGDGAGAETQRFVQETGNEILLKPCKLEEIESALVRAIKR